MNNWQGQLKKPQEEIRINEIQQQPVIEEQPVVKKKKKDIEVKQPEITEPEISNEQQTP
jgi:hypothetical protein